MSRDFDNDRRVYNTVRQGLASRMICARRRKKDPRAVLRPLVKRYYSKVCSYHRARFQFSEAAVERLATCKEREIIPILQEIERDVVSTPGGQSNGLPKHDG